MSTRITARTRRIIDEKYADAWAELWLRPGAPREVIDAAFRALARLHHPDSGGSEEAMQRLNAAYRTITTENT